MRRPGINEILDYLHCSYCNGSIIEKINELKCESCGHSYRWFQKRPVMIREENELFPASAYVESTKNISTKRSVITSKLKSIIPSQSINLARKQMLNRLSLDHGKLNKTILVVGCGNQLEQLEKHFKDTDTTFLFCDIDKQANTDVFCDAHELCFKTASFDGIISTAVFEHVLYPEKVMNEIHRVLRPSGFLYSEIPFLQNVHEGAFDFTRYTMSGHRRLCEKFEEIDAGMVAGPGTALVWSIVGFFRSMFSHSKLSSAAALISRGMFFWLKYFDYLCKNKSHALDMASCTYFYGRSRTVCTPASRIIDLYHKKDFKHI